MTKKMEKLPGPFGTTTKGFASSLTKLFFDPLKKTFSFKKEENLTKTLLSLNNSGVQRAPFGGPPTGWGQGKIGAEPRRIGTVGADRGPEGTHAPKEIRMKSKWADTVNPSLRSGLQGGRGERGQASAPTRGLESENSLSHHSYKLDTFRRSNQDTCLTHKPSVNEGDWVQSGDLLSDCESSVGGELALGQNILIAYMPWEGYNFEDAILISERLVSDDLFTSVHIERYEIEIYKDDKTERSDKRNSTSNIMEVTRNIPDAKIRDLRNLDSFGIIKPGSWVEEGDILVGKIAPINKKEISPYEKLLYTILEKQIRTYRDISLRAPKGIKAKVIDIKYFERKGTILSNDKDKKQKQKQNKQNKETRNKGTLLTKTNRVDGIHDTIGKQRLNSPPWPAGHSTQAKPADLFGTPVLAGMKAPFGPIDNTHSTPKADKGGNKQETRSKQTKKHKKILNIKRYFLNKIKLRKKEIRKINKGYSFTSATSNSLYLGDTGNSNINLNLNTRLLTTRPVSNARVAGFSRHPFYQKLTKKNSRRILTGDCCPAAGMGEKRGSKLALGLPASMRLSRGAGNTLRYSKEISPAKKSLRDIQVIHIYLAEKRKIQVGDKMAGRHGNKGIVSQILPKIDMPYLPDGSPIDMVLNPLGVPSRMNVGQIYECLLGLAGKYLGETYKVYNFEEIYGVSPVDTANPGKIAQHTSRSFVLNKLYEAKLKTGYSWLLNPNFPGKMRIYDGRTGEGYHQPVTVGLSYILRLVHMVDDKIHMRSTGPYSLVTQQPLRGRSKQGGQRLGEMEVWAIEGYGAAFTLLELLTIKSDDLTGRMTLWSNLILNKDLKIGTPEAFKVLVCELQALCLDIGLYRYNIKNWGPNKIGPEIRASETKSSAGQGNNRQKKTKLSDIQIPVSSALSLTEITNLMSFP